MKVLQDFTRKFPLLIVALTIVFVWCGVHYFPDLLPGHYARLLKEVLLAVASVIIAVLFVRPRVFHRTAKGCRYAFKKSRYYLIVNIVLAGVIPLVLAIITGIEEHGVENLISAFFIAFVDTTCVGFFEEITFRVLVFGGLLVVLGKSREGIFAAVVISSVIFGFMHVAPSFFDGTVFTTVSVIQVIVKTIECALMGILLCALYLKTHNIWPLIVLHMLTDFFLTWANTFTGTFSTVYVTGDVRETIVLTLIIVANIPVLVSAIKMLLSESVPQLGPLADDNFLPRIPDNSEKKEAKEEAAGE